MIDLSYKPKPKQEKTQPEEIFCGVIAAVIWIVIVIGWVGAL